MSLSKLNIKDSYISYGENNITDAFLVPAMKETKLYRRSVGFFSSSGIKPLINGIIALVRNGGKIELIASPRLSESDIEAMKIGYEERDKIAQERFDKGFIEEIQRLDDNTLNLLATLISNSFLDIKIVVTETTGIYHDKLGIMEDGEGNIVVFYGSPNSSLNAYQKNYEKIRIIKSWNPYQKENVEDECKEFESLWNGRNPYVKVYEYKDAAEKNLLKVIAERSNTKENGTIKLRDYQVEAIDSWVNNGYKGFYVMATGTGKTWTAIYSAKKLMENTDVLTVICAPYKHLIKQWANDVTQAFPKAKIIMVSSENPHWQEEIINAIIDKSFNKNKLIIIISTIKSFKSERFIKAVSKSKEEKLLIVDEAHRFNSLDANTRKIFRYLLGLSATPYSGSSTEKGMELMRWFGGKVFDLPIEVALEKGFLVPYYYYPIYVESTEKEEQAFIVQTKKISSCFINGKCINEELLIKSLRNRLRIISMADEKIKQLPDIISRISEREHLIVYCGDGRLFNNANGEELRHIQYVKKILSELEFKCSQFTASEDMKTRMDLIDSFNNQAIDALVAIRCLDEGINIPSIKAALILSSNDDYREFVQRRGRILRLYGDKKYANIYDVIVLPTQDMKNWAKIELRRFREYARLALNADELELELNSCLQKYGIEFEDIDVYDYENMEVSGDE